MTVFSFIEALFLTELIEIIAAYLLGYRVKKFYTVLVLINIMTNPMLNCILMILYYFHIYSFIATSVLEVFVVLAEWKLFEYTLGKGKKSYLFLSFLINLSSYMAGLLYFYCF